MAECEVWDSMAPVSCSLAGNTAAPLKGKARFFEQEIKLYKLIAGDIKTAPD